MVNAFLPVPDMEKSAEFLDTERLGKQRSEIKIMLAALTGVRFKEVAGERGILLPENRGYQNHSATVMWRGHEIQLALMGITTCTVWADRFGHDLRHGTGAETLRDMISWFNWLHNNGSDPDAMPDWWGGPVHARYRAHLLWKDQELGTTFYQANGWTETPVKLEPPYVEGL